MMADTMVDKSVCESCGADVRDESLFCYNCGTAVQPKMSEVPAPEVGQPAVIERQVPDERPPLKSAASLRKQRRASNRQPVEISWQQPAGSPKGFIIATILLSIAALVLLIVALYLR